MHVNALSASGSALSLGVTLNDSKTSFSCCLPPETLLQLIGFGLESFFPPSVHSMSPQSILESLLCRNTQPV